MPFQYRLPDGRVVTLSDDRETRISELAGYFKEFPGLTPQQALAGGRFAQATRPAVVPTEPAEAPEPDEPDIPLLDRRRLSAAIQQGAYGILDLPVSALTAISAIATPGEDTKLERDLRRAENIYMAASDEEAASLYTSQLARGLGQAGAMTALAFVPVVGQGLAIGSAVALGVSEAAKRLRQYEEETGADVPWYKETAAHGAGTVLGLSEAFLPAKLASGVRAAAPRGLSEVVGQAIKGAGEEAIQEGLAQVGQAATARGLYDKNAMDDIFYSASEDAKVGAGVGFVTNALVGSLGLRRARATGIGMEIGALDDAARQRDDLAHTNRVNEEAGVAFGSGNLDALINETGVDRNTARNILKQLSDPGLGGVSTDFISRNRNSGAAVNRRIVEDALNLSEVLKGAHQNNPQAIEFIDLLQNARLSSLQNIIAIDNERFDASPKYKEASDIADAIDRRSFEEQVTSGNIDINSYSITGQQAGLVDAAYSLGVPVLINGNAEPLSDRGRYSTRMVAAVLWPELQGVESIPALKSNLERSKKDEIIQREEARKAYEAGGDAALDAFLRRTAEIRRNSVANQNARQLQIDANLILAANNRLQAGFTDKAINDAAKAEGITPEQYRDLINTVTGIVGTQASQIQGRVEALEQAIGSSDPLAALEKVTLAVPETEKLFTPIQIRRIGRLLADKSALQELNDALFGEAVTSLNATLSDAEQPSISGGPNSSNVRLATELRKFLGRKEAPTEADIERILAVKNMRLRDSGVAVGDAAVGVNSPALKKIIQSVTGANDWGSATNEQKLLVYAKLARMTPNHGFVRDVDGRAKVFGLGGPESFSASYLPDFQEGFDPLTGAITDNNPIYRAILSKIDKRLESDDEGVVTPVKKHDIDKILQDTRNELGISSSVANEAMTRLIESGFLVKDGKTVSIAPFSPIGNNDFASPPANWSEETRQQVETREFENSFNNDSVKAALLARKDLISVLRNKHNQLYPNAQIASNEEYIDRYANDLARYLAVVDLSPARIERLDQELVSQVLEGNISKIKAALDGDNLGDTVRKGLTAELRKSKGIPLDLSDGLAVAKEQYMREIASRFNSIKATIQKELAQLGVSKDVNVQFIADIDDAFSAIEGVETLSNPDIIQRDAVFNTAPGRLIVNLSKLNLEGKATDLLGFVQDAAADTGFQILATRYLTDRQIQTLVNFSKNAVVAEGTETFGLDNPTYRVLVEAENRDRNLSEESLDRLAAARVLTDMSAGLITKTPRSVRNPFNLISNLSRTLSDAVVKNPTVMDAFRIFEQATSGYIAARGPRADVQKIRLGESTYLRFASGNQINDLEKLTAELNAVRSPSVRVDIQAKIDSILRDVAETRRKFMEQAPPDISVPETIRNINLNNEDISNTGNSMSPVPGPPKPVSEMLADSPQGEINRAAAQELQNMQQGKPHYRMPEATRVFLRNQNRISARSQELVRVAERANIVPKTNEMSTEEYIASVNENVSIESLVDNMLQEQNRAKYIDRTAPLQVLDGFVGKLAVAGPLMERHRAASLTVIASQRDNARAFTPGLYKKGVAAYKGSSVLDGSFGIDEGRVDDRLKEYQDNNDVVFKTNGVVPGFYTLATLVNSAADQKMAYLYGAAKRIKSLSNRTNQLESFLLSQQAAGISFDALRPLERELKRSKDALIAAQTVRLVDEDGNVTDTNFGSDQFVDETIRAVEEGTGNGEARIREFWAIYQAINRSNIALARDVGLIDQAEHDVLVTLDYVPFFDGSKDVTKFDPDANPIDFITNARTMSDMTVLDKNLRGGAQVNPHKLLANLNLNTQNILYHAMQNVLATRAANDLVSLGLAAEAQALPRSLDENQYLVFRENGERKIVKLSDAGTGHDLTPIVQAIMTAQTNPAKDLQGLFGGFLPKGYEKAAERMVKLTYGTSNVLRESVTRMPAFPIRNLFRDALSASNTLGDPSIFFNAIRLAVDGTTRSRAESLGLAPPIDMVTSDPAFYGGRDVTKGRKTIAEMGLTGVKVLNPINAVKIVWNTLGRITDNAEAATRIAVYEHGMAKTGDHVASTEAAIDVLNYGKRGNNSLSRLFLSTIPFASGRLQGLDVFWRATSPLLGRAGRVLPLATGETGIRRPGMQRYGVTESEYDAKPFFEKQKQAYLFGLMTIAGLSGMIELFLRFNDEDDEYANTDPRLRRENYLIPWSKHVWLRIPVPFEVGLITKTIPQTIAESIFLEQYDAVDAMRDVAGSTQRALNLGAPQIMSPFFDLWLNKDSFYGGDIIPDLQKQLSPRYQYTSSTSDLARIVAAAAEKTGLGAAMSAITPGDYSWSSPLVVEYILTKYLGTTGLYGITMADALIRSDVMPFVPFIDPRSPVGSRADFNAPESLLGGDGITRLPVLSGLLTDPRSRQGVLNEFYDLQSSLESAVRDHGNALKEASNDDKTVANAINSIEENRELMMWRGGINALYAEITRINDAMQDIITSDYFTEEEKRAAYNEFRDRRARVAAQATSIIGNIKTQQSLWDRLQNK